ncbi:MAG: hypothetical protein K2Q34_05940 [Alphaproteobacteria bacterium]|nr:hypothetical protein [Alphaproteobacteria bacterium]
MLLKFFSFLIMTLLSVDPLWARPTAVVEREYDTFRVRATVNPKVGKAEQFLEDLAKKGQVDDVIALLNRGDGVRGFSKKDRKYTTEEAKIALNALFFAKKRSAAGTFPFREGVDDFGSLAVQRHRHFVKVAWRLLDPALGYVKAGTDFKDDGAYSKFKALVREHMKFGDRNLSIQPTLSMYYLDHEVGTTNQYLSALPKAPYFHAYEPIKEGQTEEAGYMYSPIRLCLPTTGMKQLLPSNIKGKVGGIADGNLDIFVIAQNLPWKPEIDILYRPQFWLDPDAPFQQEGYDHNFNVTVSSYPAPTGNTISHSEGPITEGVNTHTEGGTNNIVSSGNSPSAGGVLNEKRNTNFSLYSLTTVNSITKHEPSTGRIQEPGRHALTLHLMLNKAGQRRMGDIAQTLSTMWPQKIYHLSEMLDADPVLSQLYRFGF